MSKIVGVTLEAKTKGFKETEKEVQDLNQDLGKTAEAVDEVNKSFDKAATFAERYGEELQPLTTRMGEAEDRLYELALAGDTTSKEYQELLTSVGNYRKTQIQTDLAVDAAATTLGQKLGGALTGATSGFAAVQGVMGLVGGESEQLEKALLKVQSALAIQQGVQGIREAIPAFKQLGTSAIKALKGIKTGIAATGVGLLVVAVGAIVAYWDDITELLGVNNQSLEEQLELEKQIADEKAKQKSEMEEIIRNNNNHIERRVKILKLEEDIKDLSIDQEKNQDAIFEKQLEILDLKKLQIGVELNSLEGLLSKEEKVNKEIELGLIRRERRRLIAQKEFDDAKKAEEAAAAGRKKKKDDLKEINRLRQEGIEQEIDEEIALQQALDAIKRENEDRFRTEQENELLLVEEKYDALEASAVGNAEALEQIEIARLNERNDINLKYDQEAYDAKKALDDKAAEDTKKRIEEERQARFEGIQKGLEYAQQGADAIQQLGDLVFANKMSQLEKGSKEEEEFARKQFKFNKALQLGGAIIDAGKAITASLAQSPIAIGPVPNPAGIASLAFAATTSALNIAKIASSKFESPGSASTSPSPGGVGGEVQAPEFNVVGDSGVNQLAQLQQQPTQAYVVSGEVTTAQALDRNRVQNATL